MKVVLINNLYKPYAVGGAERVVERRAGELVDEGNEVVIITWRPWDGWGSWVPVKSFEDDITVYRFWVPNIFSYKNLSKHNFGLKLIWHFIDIFNCWSGRIIHDILKSEQPDIVETHNLMGIGYGLRIKNKDLRIKWRHYLHDVQLVEPSGVFVWSHEKDNLAQKIYSWIMKRKFKNVDEVISPTKFLWEFYRSRGFFVNANFVLEKQPLPN
ncbi:MAG: glycosyltransferase, partial [Candidatus Magasanikiibacteriota bacterium]